MKTKALFLGVGSGLILLLFLFFLFTYIFPNFQNTQTHSPSSSNKESAKPTSLDPTLFTTKITNKYFRLPVGRSFVFESKTVDGVEKIEISIPGETKIVAGIETLVYRDIVSLNGVIVEDTKDYLAQDDKGNVWYFGEDVNNFEDGILKDHKGSWLAGIDGAEAGIWIKGEQKNGDSYRQEYYKGHAEDMRDVISVGEPVVTALGSFTDCVKFYNWTPLDETSREYKTYCSEVGAMVKEEHLVKKEITELISANP